MRKNVLPLSSGVALLIFVFFFTVHAETFSWRVASSTYVELSIQNRAYNGAVSRVDQCHCNGSQVDSCAPLDLVFFCAKVTYNDEPVVNVEVDFDVVGPVNIYFNSTISRQAQTNASGVAVASFRVPWPVEHGNEIVLGRWWATAKACLANEESSDTHWWLVRFFGDFNGDGIVGPFDFARFSIAYGSTPESLRWLSEADFDEDQRVGPYDFAFFGVEYGKRYP
jgi:hypothetical protein